MLYYRVNKKGGVYVNPFNYIGYGCVYSDKPKETIDISNTKANKTLRGLYLDYIEIEVIPKSVSERKVLEQLIEASYSPDGFGEMEPTKNRVFVFPSIETLGNTPNDVAIMYSRIVSDFNIIILNRADLSTCTLDGKVLVDIKDIERITKIKKELAFSQMNALGRRGTPLNAKFRKVFWDWQNYYIDTNDVIKLLGISRATLYAMSKSFMSEAIYSATYSDEFTTNMVDFKNKPIRGVVIDESITSLLVAMQRKMGNEDWDILGIAQVITENKIEKNPFPNLKDYMRLRLNYEFGKVAMSKAAKEYSKGKEYVEQLKKDLENM